MYKHILLPTDGSKLSEKANKHGIALAKALNAKIHRGYSITAALHHCVRIGHRHRPFEATRANIWDGAQGGSGLESSL
jgi:nucleotide-binding universal stress UspA family protein